MVINIDYGEEARRFAAIQVARYLNDRRDGAFNDPAERDAVLMMIRDAWVELRTSAPLSTLTREGREALYWTTLIFFPTFVADAGLNCIPVDFVKGTRVGEQIVAGPMRPTLDRF